MSTENIPAEPAIQFSHINKYFGRGRKRKQVIHDFSLAVGQSEIVGFVGPNGAGKSTLIKLLLQFYQPDSGSIHTFGQSVQSYEFRHNIGYLSEIPFFYDHLTARESLLFAGRLHAMDGALLGERSVHLLAQMNLTEAADQQVGTFSKGMKQRLGFAAAMIHNPPLYIFDEPMSGLDPLGRDMVKNIFTDLAARHKTIFFSSHILSDIEQLCDRIALIHQGYLLYEGTVTDFSRAGNSLEDAFVTKITEWDRNAPVD